MGVLLDGVWVDQWYDTIADYTNLSRYLRDLYQVPVIPDTVDMRHIKGHYYQSHRTINPTGIVPLGPSIDLIGAAGGS